MVINDSLFREEALEHLEALDRLLLALEDQQSDSDLNEIMRRCHSLKGSSRLIGAHHLAEILHAAETIINQVKLQQLTINTDLVNGLLAAIDEMRGALTAFSQQVDFDSQAVIDRLQKLSADNNSRIDSILPGIDREILALLTDMQVKSVRTAINDNKAFAELVFTASDKQGLAAELRAAHQALSESTSVIATVNTVTTAKKEQFKFLVFANDHDTIEKIATKLNLETIDITNNKAPPPKSDAKAKAASEKLAATLKLLKDRFLEDNLSIFGEMEQSILQLESSQQPQEVIDELFRRCHNLKGAGGTYGLHVITHISHVMENKLEQLKQSPDPVITSTDTNLLLKGVDCLRVAMEHARADSLSADIEKELLDSLNPAKQQQAQTKVSTKNTSTLASETSIRVPVNRIDHIINIASEITLGQTTREGTQGQLEKVSDTAITLLKQWQNLLNYAKPLIEQLQSDPLAARELAEFEHNIDQLARNANRTATESDNYTLQSAQATNKLITEVTQMRLVSVGRLFETVPRSVRELAQSLDKSINLELDDGDAELDKTVVEKLTEPLIHLVRNAVDHGIEPPATRKANSKTEAGTLRLAARQKGSIVEITIADDGAGIDVERVKQKALNKGICEQEELSKLSDEKVSALLFHPGFSTRDEVTQISGRGVGLDVVKQNIEILGGRIHIDSQLGKGTTFELQIPLSLSIIPVILIEENSQFYGIQTSSVDEVVLARKHEIKTENERPCLVHAGRSVPLIWLSDVIGNKRAESNRFPVLLVSSLNDVVGIVVERVETERHIMLKDLSGVLSLSKLYSGAAIQSDGKILPVLDAMSIIESSLDTTRKLVPTIKNYNTSELKILVSDDSLTTRELYRNMLTAAGFEVATAIHGADALKKLQQNNYDLLISDVQMPELDGYQLTAQVRRDKRLSALPIILISSLASEDERRKGLESGADAYIVKSLFEQGELMNRIKELTYGSL